MNRIKYLIDKLYKSSQEQFFTLYRYRTLFFLKVLFSIVRITFPGSLLVNELRIGSSSEPIFLFF